MLLLILFLLLSFQDPEIPYKPGDQFKITVDYKFKTKPMSEHFTIDYTETREQHDKRTGGPLPYLVLKVSIRKLQEGEEKVRVIDSENKLVHSMKAKLETPFDIDLGFTDDIKDGVSPNEYNIFFTGKGKGEVSRVHLIVH